MSLEITMLRMLSTRDAWSKLRGAIPRGGLEERTKQIAGRMGDYYRAFPEVTRVEAEPFLSWYFGTVKTNADAEAKASWRTLLESIQTPVAPELEAGMYDKLLTLGSGSEMGDVLNRYVEGEDIDLMAELTRVLDNHKRNRKVVQRVQIIDSNVLDLLDNHANQVGVKWRQSVINEYITPMAAGDFIGLAARPDRGKTSFLTDGCSYFAPQLEAVFGPNRPIVWFCNEGMPRKIWLRTYQSAMNMTMTELADFRRKVCKSNDTKFLDAVYEKIGGKENLIIVDAHKMTNTAVEDFVAEHNPAMVVYDMIDNFHFAGLSMHGGTRTDQVLESMYQWGRDLAGEAGHVAIATSQISGDGEGLAYPAMSMLKDSKTGKQGTFDTLLMLGASNSKGMENHRYLSAPKHKLRVDGSGTMQLEFLFDGSRGRFNVGKKSEYIPQDEQEDVPESANGVAVPVVKHATKAKDYPLDDI